MAAIPEMKITATVLIRVVDNEPIEVATFEVPIDWKPTGQNQSLVGTVRSAQISHRFQVVGAAIAHHIEKSQP